MQTTFTSRRFILLTLLFLALAGLRNTAAGQGGVVEINLCDSVYASGNQLRVPVVVTGFTDIVSVQFTIAFDTDQLTFLQVEQLDSIGLPGLSISNFGTNTPGALTFSWFLPNFELVSLPDGTALFEVVFLQSSPGPYTVSLSDEPTLIEIYGANQNELSVFGCQGFVSSGSNVFITPRFDADGDCTVQAADAVLPEWQLELSDGTETYTGYSSNGQGVVVMNVPSGTYTATWTAPSNPGLWSVCPDAGAVVVPESGVLESEVSIGASVACPQLSVSVSSGNIRPCFENNLIVVEYANLGSAVAEDAYIELTLSTALTILDSPVAYTELEPGLIRLDLGDVAVAENERWYLTTQLDCDYPVGATLCFTGQIFPNDPCEGFDPGWAGGDLEVKTDCSGGEAKFLIRNDGVGPADNLEYIVIEDAVMYAPQSISVPAGEEIAVTMPANGSTFRLESFQPTGHPDLSRPLAIIEGCGTNSSGTFSTGFVNAFPKYDDDNYFDRYCIQVTAAYDPNDKMAVPFGIDNERFIEPNGRLDYRIRFQNTGTDTAFTVIVKDTLPLGLDVSTLRLGAASHPYELTITEERTLSFVFRDILLPDSTTNEPASNGFIFFSIAQDAELPDGTKLENSAAIYFDFNDPIITNISAHTVMRDFLEIASGTDEAPVPIAHRLSPNPVGSELRIELTDYDQGDWEIVLYDGLGRPVRRQVLSSPVNRLSTAALPTGAYYYRLSNERGKWTSGQLVIQR